MLNELRHLGIIVDGNRRWAKKKGLPAFKGHEEGAKTLEKILKKLKETSIKVVSLYVWSLKNHEKRSVMERKKIFQLLRVFFNKLFKTLEKEKIKVVFSGRWQETEMKDFIKNILDKTKNFENKIINFCFMYDGQAEIVDAVKKIISKNIPKESITEEVIKENLYTKNLPPLDLIIRTGMEDGKRLSGFLLWDSSYAEFIFHNTYWPDYTEEMLIKDIEEFNRRKRRMGE